MIENKTANRESTSPYHAKDRLDIQQEMESSQYILPLVFSGLFMMLSAQMERAKRLKFIPG